MNYNDTNVFVNGRKMIWFQFSKQYTVCNKSKLCSPKRFSHIVLYSAQFYD